MYGPKNHFNFNFQIVNNVIRLKKYFPVYYGISNILTLYTHFIVFACVFLKALKSLQKIFYRQNSYYLPFIRQSSVLTVINWSLHAITKRNTFSSKVKSFRIISKKCYIISSIFSELQISELNLFKSAR